jgi:hypothetical protein
LKAYILAFGEAPVTSTTDADLITAVGRCQYGWPVGRRADAGYGTVSVDFAAADFETANYKLKIRTA